MSRFAFDPATKAALGLFGLDVVSTATTEAGAVPITGAWSRIKAVGGTAAATITLEDGTVLTSLSIAVGDPFEGPVVQIEWVSGVMHAIRV